MRYKVQYMLSLQFTCKNNLIQWPTTGIAGPVRGIRAPCVYIYIFAGVTRKVSINKINAPLALWIGKPRFNHSESVPSSSQSPPMTSTTPVHSTWNLLLPGRYQTPQEPYNKCDKHQREKISKFIVMYICLYVTQCIPQQASCQKSLCI